MDQEEPEIQTSGMACPNCYSRNPASVSFCTHCGQPTRPENGGCSSCLAELPKDEEQLMEQEEYMGFWIRAAARLIDVTITWVIWMVIEVLYGPLSTNMTLTLLIYVVGPLYYVIPMGLKGQTLGKVAIGIMVVNERGEPPGITKAIIREILGKGVSEIAIFLPYVWIGLDKNKRGWHDHIANTHVVRAPGRLGRPAPEPSTI